MFWYMMYQLILATWQLQNIGGHTTMRVYCSCLGSLKFCWWIMGERTHVSGDWLAVQWVEVTWLCSMCLSLSCIHRSGSTDQASEHELMIACIMSPDQSMSLWAEAKVKMQNRPPDQHILAVQITWQRTWVWGEQRTRAKYYNPPRRI